MSVLRKRAVVGLSLAVAATGFLAQLPASANPAGTALVISEVYGAGGNSGAVYNADFVELYNPTAAPLSLSGLSVHYRAGTGGSGGTPFALTGSVPSHAHWLIQMGAAGATGAALPTPDATALPAFTMSAAGGQVYLLNGTTAITTSGDMSANPAVVDMVGATGSTSFEAAATSAAATATNSLNRSAAGADTNSNSADFALAAPSPENGGGVVVPPDVVDATIAEIQGTGATSPLAGQTVHTTGIVAAKYPTGGFSGIYIQTAGTGTGTDATPGASDAVFVFGSQSGAATFSVGDYVDVTGPVSEFAGTTEITPSSGGVIPASGTGDPVTPLAAAYPTTEATREAHEGELMAPTDQFTVTNTFNLNNFAEIGLATGDKPLIQWTDVARPGTPAATAVIADNAARGVILSDGSSLNYLSTANGGANQDIPLPWLSPTNPIRVGAQATLHAPVILDFRNNLWNFEPTSQVTDEGASVATFTNTRTAAPEDVGGNLKLATFNVLNYFNTTGEAWVAAGHSCTYFDDRDGNHIGDNVCSDNGPRGAATEASRVRQLDKEVAAINALGGDIVSLEEIENSVALGEPNRDDALSSLVDALNAAAGDGTWAFAPSPAAADLPPTADQDVIRTAFIYKPAKVATVGGSQVLTGSAAFANAREPMAQAFKAKGAADSAAFAVIVNHFKSKGNSTPPATGDNADTGDGQGAFNGDRTLQAAALATFANSFAASHGTAKVFLTGDFNSYTEEDPMHVLYDAGFNAVVSDTPGESTYSFSGLSGSLDHVLANSAAFADVAGADVWNINSGESVAFEYSRYNYNATNFYQANQYRASDHDPEIVGINADATPANVELNLLGVNDFHGRINANTVKWAGTVEQLRAAGGEANTLMIGAGDLVGASEFASAVANDQPTIDMFNELDLDASAVGNHEFDKGWADLRDRIIGTSGSRNAQWDYLGANVYLKGTTTPALPEYATFEKDGLTIGVIGAVTEETKTLVSPGGITEIDFGNPVDAVNRVAGELSDGDPSNGEADVIIASFHSGAQVGAGSTFAQEVAKGGEFAQMVNLDPAVDVIFNGHTHQTYAWDAPIPGEPTKTRPIIQTGEYGTNVGQVLLTVSPGTGDVVSYTEHNEPRTTVPDATLVSQFPRVAEVKATVDAALANAATIGNQPVGKITGDITRALSGGTYTGGVYIGGTTEDRGSESTIGDLVGNALRDGLPAGTADLGITNPGGLRTDLKFAGDTSSNSLNSNGVVTYAEANSVLPFVNNIWTLDLTGTQLKAVLEQQWQPTGAARPFLALGLSDNVRTTQDASKPVGSRITSVVIDGVPLDPAHIYAVSTFSFLGTGGDNFTAFSQGTHQDTGLVDRDLWIQYLMDHADAGIAPDFARQQVAESGVPTDVVAGDNVSFTLLKLNLTSLGSRENITVAVYVRNGNESRKIGDFPVTNGTANVSFTAPANLVGHNTVTAIANPSMTQVGLPLTASATSVSATAAPMVYGTDGAVDVTVTSGVPVGGDVEVCDGATHVGTGTVTAGTGTVVIPGTSLAPGSHTLTVNYLGDQQNNPSSTTVQVTVAKATSTVEATVSPAQIDVKGGTASVDVTVTAAGVSPTGVVGVFVGGSLVQAAELTDGAATLEVGPFPSLGVNAFQVRYLGDDNVGTSLVDKTVTVVKATPTMTVTKSPAVVHANTTKVTLTVQLTAPGFTPVTGTVKVSAGGHSYARVLSGGTAVFTLSPFDGTGAKQVNVTYVAQTLTKQVKKTITITVVR